MAHKPTSYITLVGTAAGEFIFSTVGNESISALGGNDIIFGLGGNDTIDGGTGNDTVEFTGNFANYSIAQDATTKAFTFTDLRAGSPDGTDVVFNVENFYFADGSYTASGLLNVAPSGLTLTGGTLAENSRSGTLVGTLKGTDPNAGDVLTYSLTDSAGGRFVVNKTTGAITVANGAVLDFETTPQLSITARVTDPLGLTYDKVFTINLTNVNEAPNGLTLTGGTIKENSAAGTTVGTLKGTDPDKGDVLSYSLTDNANGRFVVDATTGIITVAQGALLDYETTPQITITARVTDKGGLKYDKVFTVSLTNVLGKTFIGTSGNDGLTGTGEEDSISGLAGDDTIFGAAGNDTINGGAGNDLLDGGVGTDTVVYSGKRLDYHITQDPISGNYTITDLRTNSPDGTDIVSNTELFQFSDGTLNATVLLGPFQGLTITDNSFNSVIYGSDANDVILESNSWGTDTIIGFTGNDTISGDGFTVSYDYLDATRGSVSITALNATTFSANAGVGDTDTIIDKVPLDGTSGVSFIGSSGNDVFDLSQYGLYSWSWLTGGAGNDTMIGNGNETIIANYFNLPFGHGLTIALNGSTPTFVTVQAGTDVDQLVNIEAIYGTLFSDSIVGDNYDNWLIGSGGNDTIFGQGGNDYLESGSNGLYDGGSGNDTLVGDGTLTGGTGNDLFQFYSFQNVVITDFDAYGMGQDTLQFAYDPQITDWKSLLAHTQQQGSDIVISENFSDGTSSSLTLKNITLAAFQNSNVKFGS